MKQRRILSALTLLPLFSVLACAPQPTLTPSSYTPPREAPPSVDPPAKRAADLPLAVARVEAAPNAAAALIAFRKSCPSLRMRDDRSGLTHPGDWDEPCAAATTARDPEAFFRNSFRRIAIDSGNGFATGYFEPEIAGSRSRAPGYATPFYRRPPDLVDVDLGAFAKDLKGRKLRGRVVGKALAPYHDRAAIVAGALAGRGLELAFAADPNEAFFLEIQGSGRLALPGGGIMRIGYDSQNGRDYVAIGKVLLDRGDLPKGGVNMDSILAWLRANPGKAPALLAANPSVVFFREITQGGIDDGPIGAMGIPVTANVSVAADPAYIPLGAPLVVATTLPGDRRLEAMMVAQDTGGAIKGPNRIDLFRGSGAAARAEAGAQSAAARVYVLIPVTAATRLAR